MNEKLYYNNEARDVASLADWKDSHIEFLPVDEVFDFDTWKSENLTDVDDLPDLCDLEDLIKFPLRDVEGEYLVAELDSDDSADYPYIPLWVWEEISEYDDIFSDINIGGYVNFPIAIMQLKLLRGHPIPEIGYTGHGFVGWDGRIIKIESTTPP